MNKKQIFLTVLALVLVCALSIMGTVAYLTNTTETVTNTFVAAGGGQLIDPDGEDDEEGNDDDGAITLQEHVATKVMSGEGESALWTGKYEIKDDAATTAAQRYDILPGMVIPKDPYVTVTGKTETPAYLYIEVINNLNFSTEVDGEETLVIDSAHWIDLEITGRDIYVYTVDGTNPAIVTEDVAKTNIIEGNKFTVNKDVDPTALDADETLKFNAYLAQASIGEVTDPAQIFTTCFGTTETPSPENP